MSGTRTARTRAGQIAFRSAAKQGSKTPDSEGSPTAARSPRNGAAPASVAPPRRDHQTTLDRIVETAIYLQTESRRLAREQCAKYGITATQLNVLKLLQTVGELSLSEVGKRMASTNSTVTG